MRSVYSIKNHLFNSFFLIILFNYTYTSYAFEKVHSSEINNLIANKLTDTIFLNTKVGNIKKISDRDSIDGWIKITGEIYQKQTNIIAFEADRLNISENKATLKLTLNREGKIINCELAKYGKLNQFNLILKEFADEINSKYKNKIFEISNFSNSNIEFLIPFYFHLD